MSRTEARRIHARLEAAFDRYNLAALDGAEPTMALFIEALEAEGLELSLRGASPVEAASAGDATAASAGDEAGEDGSTGELASATRGGWLARLGRGVH